MADVSPRARDRQRSAERDGESRRRRRSRSRSRDRRRSRSRSPDRRRSRERERRRSRSKSADGYDPEAKRRRPTWFDIPPVGGVPVPISQLPGAVLVAPDVPISAPVGGLSYASGNQQATRHARRIYVGGLPPSVRDDDIAMFFSNALAAVGGTTAGPGSCVVSVYVNTEKKFAFVELRTVEEASNAMALDGIMFEGVAVRVRRPADYNAAAAAALGPAAPNPNLNLAAIGLEKQQDGTAGGMGRDTTGQQGATQTHQPSQQQPGGSDRIFVGGLPYYLGDQECRELLGAFGAIRSFDLIKDRTTGQSKGYGFVVYEEPSVGPLAIEGLHGMRIGDRSLTVRKAEGVQRSVPAGGPAAPVGDGGPPAIAPPRVIKLAEAVTVEELRDDDEYTDIMDDMKEELSKFGTVVALHIPRPPADGETPPPGLGKVVAEFAEPTHAWDARNALHGRKFGGRIVQAALVTEDDYKSRRWD
jgi:splicing factor U2AF 65 kDa subunit